MTLREVLREIFRSGADYLGHRGPGGVVLVHKDELIPFIETNDSAEIEEVIARFESRRALSFDQSLEGKIFFVAEEDPANAAADKKGLPQWWDVPIPLFSTRLGGFNPAGVREYGSLEGLVKALEVAVSAGDDVVSVWHEGCERVFMIHPLGDGIYRLEDISLESASAREICKWAAVGRSMVDRFRDNGLDVRVFDPQEVVPPGGEVVPCMWEKELVGYLFIPLPQEDGMERSRPSRGSRAKRSKGTGET
ncbi:hypothetical protein TheveDRAFT_0784 [Thermanaerovibrio velox DSM 12556]|uniref:Uncharacterized protein n=1 Tax=Thermanaerovibrio velox DSM 12556 TaxID=926567 RepID=H0URJ4_9BACT|nr:hypothetical protein [Thermanaerovibrio velox]EHM09933.1 hypothetical protein TheveDRAFT_0784 [Thermanaerovibrio velox DSM 12556]